MPRIAISGHRGLPPETEQLIDLAIRKLLTATSGEITGLSCLADGADQIFARAVLDQGGTIEAILPARRYRERLPEEAHAEYDRLLSAAGNVHHMNFTEPGSDAYMAASAYMVTHADELWSVWNGQPARGYGGTADVVAYAHEHDIPVKVIWPDGARRDPVTGSPYPSH